MQYPHGTIIAVADGETLRVFRNVGDEVHLRLVELKQPQLHGHNKGSGRRHHSGEDNPDESRLNEDSFAAATADWLNLQALDGATEHLFIVATPRTLGELRRHYHKALEVKLLGELTGEYTKHSAEQIHEALRNFT